MDRQEKAVAEAIARYVYHAEGLETLAFSGIEDFVERRAQDYIAYARAAIAASDAKYVPGLVQVLMKGAFSCACNPAFSKECETALAKLPEEYRK